MDFTLNSVLQLIHLQNKERRLEQARMIVLKILFEAMKLLSRSQPMIGFVAVKKVRNFVTNFVRNIQPKFTLGPALAAEVAPDVF